MQRPAFGARRFPTRRAPHTDPYANPSTLFSHTRLAALPPPPHAPQWTGAQPHSNSVPPSPTNDGFPTSPIVDLAPGSSSTIHKTVLKRPAIATLHVDGTRVTNAADVARQFAAELRVLRTVAAAGAHPNIVGFVDRLALSAMLEGTIPGGAVSTFRTARAVVSEQERLVWCDEVLSALCFVHSLGLTHGDINTLNVLIVPSRALHGRAFGRAKLIDFGRSTAVGKHEYPAPCARPFCAPEVTRAWDRAMRGAAVVHERRSRSKSRGRAAASGENTPRATVASRFPPSGTHTPASCTTPCTPTATSGTLPSSLDVDPPSLSSSISSVSSLSAGTQERDSSPDSPTSPDSLTSPVESASTNSKVLPIPVPRRTRPKLPQRKTLPAPPVEPTIPDGQLADAYSFDAYSHHSARYLPYFNPPFDTTGCPAPAHLLPTELFLYQTDPSHPDAPRVKTVASRVKKWMARWDLRKPLDESETEDEEDDEDAEMTVRDDSGELDAKAVEDDEDLGALGLGLEGMDEPEVGDEGYDSDDVEIHMVWG
ncbi:Protein tyrosine kinase [Rhizoctonia solani]|uniref:Protein tyrosine kinase n=1 Tax=Rhizoctonia solani TaxID=456999 RepID=A0A8H7IFQ3_9AGAM|nr:Protein tyrosine kinase [Rhizoctonia solani]